MTKAIRNTEQWHHANLDFSSHGIDLSFIWDPFINSTDLTRELVSTQHRQPGHAGNHTTSPSILLIGAGSWFARYLDGTWQLRYQDAIKRLFKIAAAPNQSISNVSFTDSILFLPVQAPIYDRLPDARWQTMTEPKIDAMNAQLMDLSITERATVIWSLERMTRSQDDTFMRDGIHNTDQVNARKADVLLNLYCNSRPLNMMSSSVPHDRTCCNSDNTSSSLQIMVLWACVAVILRTYIANRSKKPTSLGRMLPSPDVLHALFIFGSVLVFCFICDRTNVFVKEHKNFLNSNFMAMVSIVIALGIATIRRSSAPISMASVGSPRQNEAPYLSRDQTDEMKGWMQALILIYHWTGGSTILWIYQIIRVLVAAYLFLTGFGHSVYFLKKDDYSFKRCALVLVRLNLLSCALPFVMGTDYLFYYFAPLSSFWFIIIFATMRIKKQWNKSLKLFSLKLYISLLLVTLLTLTPGLLELIFKTLFYCCNISWNASEWRFRVTLDLLIVQKGMLLGLFFHRCTEPSKDLDYIQEVRSTLIEWSRDHRNALSFLSFSTLLPYFYLTNKLLQTKQQFNQFHIVLSIIPIIGFLAIRNICRAFRSTYSWTFAWLGRISLETFTLQYHIWLTADTKGILRVGLVPIGSPVGRWIESFILTVIFLYASWWMAWSTHVITTWVLHTPKLEKSRRSDKLEKRGSELPSIEVRTPSGGLEKRRLSEYKDVRLDEEEGYDSVRSSRCVPSTVSESGEGLMAVLQRDLRIRVGLILLGMWYLNTRSR